MKIQVTQDDIEQGISGSCTQCPIAIAVNRAFPDEYDVEVYGGAIFVGLSCFKHNDGQIANFMKMFDAGIPVKPFEFDLNI